MEHRSTNAWISVAMPSSRRETFLKRYGWWKLFLENFTIQSITLHHFRKRQILPLLEEKVDIFLKNFFCLASFWSFLSSVLVVLSFIHKLRGLLLSRRFNDCLIWKWVVYSSMLLEHCWQLNQSISCPFLCNRSTKKRVSDVTHGTKAFRKEEEIHTTGLPVVLEKVM